MAKYSISIHRIIFFLWIIAVLSVNNVFAEIQRCVRIEQFGAENAGADSYLAPAIKTMLATRLMAENIAVAGLDPSVQDDSSCFHISGEINAHDERIIITVNLMDAENGRKLSTWDIRSGMDQVVTDISLYSVEIADSIEEYNSASITADSSLSSSYGQATESEAPVIQDTGLAIARMHPDKMLHEKQIVETPVSEAIGSEKGDMEKGKQEEEGWFWPWAGDASDEAEDKKGEEKRTVYLKSRHDLPYPPPEPLKDRKSIAVMPEDVKEEIHGREEETGWFSWLWPFGSDSRPERQEDAVNSTSSGNLRRIKGNAIPLWQWN